jgi:hypothetical protein
MPLPQVNDRIKEIPAQTLRAVFAGIGQMLLIADKLRARAAEQISSTGAPPATKPADAAGSDAVPATKPADPARAADAARPADQAPSPPPQAPDKPAQTTRAKRAARPAPPQRPRWRSLDETGNVRLLDEGEEELASEAGASTGADAVPAAAPAQPAPATPAANPAPAASPAPAQPAPAAATATPAATSSAGAAALPLPNYDQLSLASLRARLRVLDAAQVSLLLDYEKAHESRPDVVTMFERRIAKLNEGG